MSSPEQNYFFRFAMRYPVKYYSLTVANGKTFVLVFCFLYIDSTKEPCLSLLKTRLVRLYTVIHKTPKTRTLSEYIHGTL